MRCLAVLIVICFLFPASVFSMASKDSAALFLEGKNVKNINSPKKIVMLGKGTVNLSFKLPEGYQLNEEAPFHMAWKSNQTAVNFTGKTELKGGKFPVPIKIPMEARPGRDEMTFQAAVYYCRDQSTLCFFDHLHIHVPVEVRETGPSEINVEVDIVPKA